MERIHDTHSTQALDARLTEVPVAPQKMPGRPHDATFRILQTWDPTAAGKESRLPALEELSGSFLQLFSHKHKLRNI